MREALDQLLRKIADQSATIGVVGLGYVGLPVACEFARVGFRVVGVDVKEERVARINAAVSPIEGNEPGLADLLAEVIANGRFQASTRYGALTEADIVTINVDTPVDEDRTPHFEALRAACTDLGSVLKLGAMVIVESTVAPGTMCRQVRPWLEHASGREAGTGFYLGHCPERVMPGKLLHNLRSVGRVVGGQTAAVADVMVRLYRHVVHAELDPTDLLTAELVKTAENAYRDVNIAFANEVALICEAVGGNVWRVRDLVNRSPGRAMLLPGSGVGGHCIPKDPWLLASAFGARRDESLLATARRVNDAMPAEVARLTADALAEGGVAPREAKVLVLGHSYLENSDDTRNSPSAVLACLLLELGCEVTVHDPYVPSLARDLQTALSGQDAIVISVAHDQYFTLRPDVLASVMSHRIVIDARHVLDLAQFEERGFVIRAVGVAPGHRIEAYAAL